MRGFRAWAQAGAAIATAAIENQIENVRKLLPLLENTSTFFVVGYQIVGTVRAS
jgi:hypothetical protein